MTTSYTGSMDADPRQMVSIRLRSSSVAAVDALAAEMPCDRSTMLRMLLKRGLEETQKDRRRVSGVNTR